MEEQKILKSKIINGDCLEELKKLPDNSIDLICTDPPYRFGFMGKKWDQKQDFTDIWRECLRVLKPGAFAFIMNAPRSDCQLLLLKELADVGFNIKFSPIFWCYASGFPKAANISKLIDRKKGLKREVIGNYEHPGRKNRSYQTTSNVFSGDRKNDIIDVPKWDEHRNTKHTRQNLYQSGKNLIGNSDQVIKGMFLTEPACDESKKLKGSYAGCQLKPALEIINRIQKPFTEYEYLIIMISYCFKLISKCQNVNIVESCLNQNQIQKESIVLNNVLEKIEEVIKVRIGKVGNVYEMMDMLKYIKDIKMEKQYINLNTVSLWKSILIDLLIQMNMFTTEMVSEMITELKILNYYLVQIIQKNTQIRNPKNNHLNGNRLDVNIVENILKNVLIKLKSQKQISVQENVSINTFMKDRKEFVQFVESNSTTITKKSNTVHKNVTINQEKGINCVNVVMKPLSTKSYIDQALTNGKGVTWLSKCRIPYAELEGIPKSTGKPCSPSDSRIYNWNSPEYQKLKKKMVGGRFKQNQRWTYGDTPVDGFKPQEYDTIEINLDGRVPANLLVSDDSLLEYSKYFSLDIWWDKHIKDLPKEQQQIFPCLYVPKPSKKEKNKGLDDLKEKKVTDGRKAKVDVPFQRGETVRKNTHVSVKPISLMSYLINLGSQPNDVVLDPFSGSGTTGIACKLDDRKFILIERDPEYYEIIKARIKAFRKQKKLNSFF